MEQVDMILGMTDRAGRPKSGPFLEAATARIAREERLWEIDRETRLPWG
jgi:hypothetical protein